MLLRAPSLAVAWCLAAHTPAPTETAPTPTRPSVMLWPDQPAIASELAEFEASAAARALVPSRLALVSRAAFAAELEGARTAAAAAVATQVAAMERELAAVRDAWLGQRWDVMIEQLDALERERLPLLAIPARCDTLWEIELRRGLAHRGRKAVGDADEAARRFALALALAPERRPARELWGPEVVAEFLRVVEAQSVAVPLATAIGSDPTHASIHVDCQPLDASGRAALRPGLHVVHAAAVGHRTVARLIETPASAPVALSLPPSDETDALRRLAADSFDGGLRLERNDERRALVAAAAARDIDAVVLVGRRDDAVVARALVGAGISPTARHGELGEAVAAALAWVDADGHLTRPASADVSASAQRVDASPKQRRKVVHSWWLWTIVGIAVELGVGLGVGLGLRERQPDHLVVYGPR
ncbi:MAG: hypothetical protein IPH07_27715 [Deltaproteobacteria bacterium]|nr:hypothetical protein [Deltaproteobacteria bacterium]